MADIFSTGAIRHVRACARWLFPAMLVMLSCIAPAIAQPDVQLSPTEPVSRWLLPDVIIQSAAHIGDTTLVVWGTTAMLTDTSIVPILGMRMVRDTVSSEWRTLSDDGARPYGVVTVMAVGDRFLVLWNDRRASSPGIYARVVSSDGEVGDVVFFGAGVLASAAECRLLRLPAGGLILAWTDLRSTQPGIWTRELDAGGKVTGAERLAGAGHLRSAISLGAIPGGYFLDRDGLPPLYLRSDGSVAETNVPGLGLDGPYLVDDDGTIATVSDSLLMISTGPPDNATTHNIRLKFAANALPKLSAIRHDASGYTIIYPAWLSTYVGEIWLHRLRVEGDSVVSDTVLDYRKLSVAVGPWSEQFSKLDVARIRHACDGADTVVLSCVVTRETGRTSHDEVRLTLQYGVDARGVMGPLAISVSYSPISFLPIEVPGCDADVGGRVAVVRESDSVRLSFNVPRPGTSLHLILLAPSATRVTLGDHLYPCLYPIDDSLHLVWSHGRSVTTFSYGGADFHADTPVHPLTLTLPGNSSAAMLRRSVTMQAPNGHPVISVVENIVHDVDPGWVTQWSTEGTLGLYIPLQGGWRSVLSEESFQEGQVDTLIRGPWLGYDPETGGILVATDIGNERRLYELDTSGGMKTSQYSVHAPRPRAILWWGTRGRWLDADTLAVSLMDRTKLLVSTRFTIAAIARFMSLGDSSFLRWYPTRGYDAVDKPHGRSVTFERYDIAALAAGPRATYIVDLPVGMSDLAVVERPSDHAIHLLAGSDDGLHHITLDAMLVPRSLDSVVSQTRTRVTRPSGVFKDDTLYAAWEDHRDAGTYIYGRALAGFPQTPVHPVPQDTSHHGGDSTHAVDSLQVADSLASHDSQGNPLAVIPAELLHLSVYPVPASDHIVVSFRLPVAGDVSIELYDLLGRRVLGRSMGAMGVGPVVERWSLSGVGAGVYFLRLHGPGGAVDVRKIMLLGS